MQGGGGSPVCWNEEQLQLLIDAITASGGGGGSGPFVPVGTFQTQDITGGPALNIIPPAGVNSIWFQITGNRSVNYRVDGLDATALLGGGIRYNPDTILRDDTLTTKYSFHVTTGGGFALITYQLGKV